MIPLLAWTYTNVPKQLLIGTSQASKHLIISLSDDHQVALPSFAARLPKLLVEFWECHYTCLTHRIRVPSSSGLSFHLMGACSKPRTYSGKATANYKASSLLLLVSPEILQSYCPYCGVKVTRRLLINQAE